MSFFKCMISVERLSGTTNIRIIKILKSGDKFLTQSNSTDHDCLCHMDSQGLSQTLYLKVLTHEHVSHGGFRFVYDLHT
jgi:hypothetical protein